MIHDFMHDLTGVQIAIVASAQVAVAIWGFRKLVKGDDSAECYQCGGGPQQHELRDGALGTYEICLYPRDDHDGLHPRVKIYQHQRRTARKAFTR